MSQKRTGLPTVVTLACWLAGTQVPLIAHAGNGETTTTAAAAADPTFDPNLDLDALDLEQLLDIRITTATKTESRVEEAPAVVSVVTADDLRAWGYRSIAEVLEHTPGFYVVDDHILPNVGVRGTAGGLFAESSAIKVLLNGNSVSFKTTGGNWLGPELVPLSAVDHIEIICGPASALYGADAFLGVVNIITRPGASVAGGSIAGADLRAAGAATAYRELSVDADTAVGVSLGGLDVLLSARLDSQDRSGLQIPDSSPDPHLPAYNAGTRTASDLRQASRVAYGELDYALTQRQHVSLSVYWSSIDRGGDFAPWLQLAHGVSERGIANRTLVSLQHGLAALAYEAELFDGLSITVRGSYFAGAPTDRDSLEVGSDIFRVKRDFGYQGFEAGGEARYRILDSLTAVVGAELTDDREQLPAALHELKYDIGELEAGAIVEPSGPTSHEDLQNIGAFGQLLWNGFDQRLHLTAGLRYDRHNIYGNQVSGRVGVVALPVERLSIKLLYGTAFKAPSPLLLYATPYATGDIVGNPDLQPQYVHTVEGDVSYKLGKNALLSSNVSYSYLLDMAEFFQQGANRSARNFAESGSLCWQGKLDAWVEHWLGGYAAFEWQHTVRNPGEAGYMRDILGSAAPVYPDYIVRFGVKTLPGTLPVVLAVDGLYVGERRATDMNTLAAGTRYELPPYLLLDATLSSEALTLLEGKRTVLSLSARNLTNTRRSDPGFAGVDYPLAPLTVFIEWQQQL